MAESLISITIPPGQLEALQKALDPMQLRSALWQATTRTTHQGREALVKVLQKRIYVDKKHIDRVITSNVVRGDVPHGEIVISRERIPLSAFRVWGGGGGFGGGGVVVQLSADREPIVLKHAFTAKVKAGGAESNANHVGIFTRGKHLPTSGPNQNKGHILPSGFVSRLVIQERFGPTIAGLANVPATFNAMKETVEEIFRKNVLSQLSRFGMVGRYEAASEAAA